MSRAECLFHKCALKKNALPYNLAAVDNIYALGQLAIDFAALEVVVGLGIEN